MKDFVRVYGRIAGMAAGAAFVLSVLVGLVSRNPFAVALVRALLLAILFGGLGAGLKFVYAKYLSVPTAARQTPVPAEGESGRNIDITLPEESPPVQRRQHDQQELETQPGMERPAAEPVIPHLEESREAGMEDSFADELPPLTDPDVAFSSGSGEDTESGAEGVEEAESVGEEAPSSPSSSADRHRAETSGDAGLDALPDISTLGTPSAGRAAEQSAAQGRRSASRDTPEDAMRGKLGGQDPATLARAIRTVLKRDEKG